MRSQDASHPSKLPGTRRPGIVMKCAKLRSSSILLKVPFFWRLFGPTSATPYGEVGLAPAPHYRYCSLPLKRCLSTLSERIFDSSVDRGTPSLAAAPVGPETRPLLAASAASTRDRSWAVNS